ncbi:TPA: transglutaminase domain-containing protein, partial [Clostridioides difficile]|nr:transglutaminase domain-containing protein [Clostridioides difficile]
MKKIRKLTTKLLITTIVLISGMSMTVYGMTAKEVTAKTPKSYVTGTNSVYGPKLSQAQLNSVAQATADFMNKKITKNMTTDAKILVAYNHIKNNTTYVDWNAVEGANTAYTLVTKKGACSGMARSMKALCDAMGIESYYVHSTSNDHQWNLIRFGDGRLYHVDIDANKSAGKDIIYKSLSHPLPFDKTAYPKVGAIVQTVKPEQ